MIFRRARGAGSDARVRPGLREVTATLRRHAEYLVEFYDGDELRACRDIRKHIAWYLKGFPAGSSVRNKLALVDSLAALDALIATMDLDHPWPGEPAEGPRGRAGSPRVVALPVPGGPAGIRAPFVPMRSVVTEVDVRDPARMRVVRTLELDGYARIDFRLSANGVPYYIEANTNPEIARAEEFASAALHAGIEYPDLIQRILALGISRAGSRGVEP